MDVRIRLMTNARVSTGGLYVGRCLARAVDLLWENGSNGQQF